MYIIMQPMPAPFGAHNAPSINPVPSSCVSKPRICCVLLPAACLDLNPQVLLTTNEQGARFVKVRVRTICIPQVSQAGRQGNSGCRGTQQQLHRAGAKLLSGICCIRMDLCFVNLFINL
jgi:hypothetical protein